MKKYYQFLILMLGIAGSLFVQSCVDEQSPTDALELLSGSRGYPLNAVDGSGISGNVVFEEGEGGYTKVTINLSGTPDGGAHPAHIHFNSAAEGGDIAISLEPINGTTGTSVTLVNQLDDGTFIDYERLIAFEGYVNVHLAYGQLETVVAQGDIGGNALDGNSKRYNLLTKDVDGISGTILFEKSVGGFTVATLEIEGTPSGGSHPAHIHANSAAEGGGILVSFNPVDGTTGMSRTIIRTDDAGNPISYEDILNIDGYVNVHLSANDLGTIVAQGDIGSNELTENFKEYSLNELAVPGISGSITFKERMNGFTLATIQLENTPEGGTHPAHIHANSAAEGGGIIVSFTPVDGTTGMSQTTIRALNNGQPLMYDQILELDGYVNVHLSMNQLGTIVAQGDIGANELTGVSKMYPLNELAVPGIDGSITFEERKNGFSLATIMLNNTPDGGIHPAHIHANSAAEGGGILVSFNPVDGTSGMSKTTIRSQDSGELLTYEQIMEMDGYVNVHLSLNQLGVIVAQGDIGGNELTGVMKMYSLNERAVPGIDGSITFEERMNGFTLATIQLNNTPDGGIHPAHIHANSAAEGGGIIVSFNPVDGSSGMSKTTIRGLDDGTPLMYEDLLTIDGYVNVHLSINQLGVIVAQGDIGGNELTGMTSSYDLGELAVPGISGTITFSERQNGFTLATIQLENTPDGGIHPAHIHANSAATGGGIIVSFNPVNGTTGMSQTTLRALDDGTALTYEDLQTIDGYVNVHLSPEQLGVIVAQGNIGSNVLVAV
ncbi:CHRD domain-containing protein [Cyclobacterium jeungdonense]|uniref:CHRD domain-containing protein n=1 Tax=Cyclobacterium jeungdonense TaxID=708087 RepID=A0ABT8C5H4_9BACT|nr:CHRD domain-containing protein [Cyclobacterium jeungdonense]MDN3687352.1 CHRD domain-containing protein [Cyclobacterium jeungdonense]